MAAEGGKEWWWRVRDPMQRKLDRVLAKAKVVQVLPLVWRCAKPDWLSDAELRDALLLLLQRGSRPGEAATSSAFREELLRWLDRSSSSSAEPLKDCATLVDCILQFDLVCDTLTSSGCTAQLERVLYEVYHRGRALRLPMPDSLVDSVIDRLMKLRHLQSQSAGVAEPRDALEETTCLWGWVDLLQRYIEKLIDKLEMLPEDTVQSASGERQEVPEDVVVVQSASGERLLLPEDVVQSGSSERLEVPGDIVMSASGLLLQEDIEQCPSGERLLLPEDVVQYESSERLEVPEDILQSASSERLLLPEDVVQYESSERLEVAEDSLQSASSERLMLPENVVQSESSERLLLPEDIVQSEPSERLEVPEDIVQSASGERLLLSEDTVQSASGERLLLPEDIGQSASSERLLLPEDVVQSGSSERLEVPEGIVQSASSERLLSEDTVQFGIGESLLLLPEDVGEVDEECLILTTIVIVAMRVIKEYFGHESKELPWEEMEFFLVAFYTSNTDFYSEKFIVASPEKTKKYLRYFSTKLCGLKCKYGSENVNHLYEKSNAFMSQDDRSAFMAYFLGSNSQSSDKDLQEFHRDCESLKDFHSLRRIDWFLGLAIEVLEDSHWEVRGKQALRRVLFMLGELFNNSWSSPNLSFHCISIITCMAPVGALKLMRNVRDGVAHPERGEVLEMPQTSEARDALAGELKQVKRVVRMLLFHLPDAFLKDQCCDALREEITVHRLRGLLIYVYKNLINHESVLAFIRSRIEHVESKADVDQGQKEQLLKYIETFEELNAEQLRDCIASRCKKKIKDKGFHDYFNLHSSLLLFLGMMKSLQDWPISDFDFLHLIQLSRLTLTSSRGLDSTLMLQSCTTPSDLFRKSRTEELQVHKGLDANINRINEILNILWTPFALLLHIVRALRHWITLLILRLSRWFLTITLLLSCRPAPTSDDFQRRCCAVSSEFGKGAADKELLNLLRSIESWSNPVLNILVLEDCLMRLASETPQNEDKTPVTDLVSPILFGRALRKALNSEDTFLKECLQPMVELALFTTRMVEQSPEVGRAQLAAQPRVRGLREAEADYEDLLQLARLKDRMFRSARRGDLGGVRRAAEAGMYLGSRDHQGRSLLHVAAEADQDNVLRWLLDTEEIVDLQDTDSRGHTPLHVAASETVARLLLEAAGSAASDLVISADAEGNCPLHLAALRGGLGVVRLLLGAPWHADPSADPGDMGWTPLLLAACAGHSDAFVALLGEQLKRGGSAQEPSGLESCLVVALEGGSVDVVRRLLVEFPQGARVDLGGGWTALFHAAQHGHADLVRLLLDSGADPTQRDSAEDTPLYCAVRNGHLQVLHLLMDEATDPEDPLLSWAAQFGHEEVAAELIQRGADVNAADADNMSPLHFAVIGGARMVRLLLRRGARRHVVDDAGRTPLALAAMLGSADTVNALLEREDKTAAGEEWVPKDRVRPEDNAEAGVCIEGNVRIEDKVPPEENNSAVGNAGSEDKVHAKVRVSPEDKTDAAENAGAEYEVGSDGSEDKVHAEEKIPPEDKTDVVDDAGAEYEVGSDDKVHAEVEVPPEDMTDAVDNAGAEYKVGSEDKVPAEETVQPEDKTIVVDHASAEDEVGSEDKVRARDKTGAEENAGSGDEVLVEEKVGDGYQANAEIEIVSEDKARAEDKANVNNETGFEEKVRADDKANNEDNGTAVGKGRHEDKAKDEDNAGIVDKIGDEDKNALALLHHTDHAGRTALHHAMFGGSLATVKCLLEREVELTVGNKNDSFGPLVFRRDDRGRTPLDVAVASGCSNSIIGELLQCMSRDDFSGVSLDEVLAMVRHAQQSAERLESTSVLQQLTVWLDSWREENIFEVRCISC